MAKGADILVFDTVEAGKLLKANSMLRAITHPLRMKIIAYMDKNGPVNVNKIYNTMNLEQSIASQHLKILRSTGYVQTKREGKFIFYSVNYQLIIDTLKVIEKYRVK